MIESSFTLNRRIGKCSILELLGIGINITLCMFLHTKKDVVSS